MATPEKKNETLGEKIIRLADVCDDIRREIYQHEVFITFNGDEHAEMFRDWLNDRGWGDFASWVAQHGAEY